MSNVIRQFHTLCNHMQTIISALTPIYKAMLEFAQGLVESDLHAKLRDSRSIRYEKNHAKTNLLADGRTDGQTLPRVVLVCHHMTGGKVEATQLKDHIHR